MRTSGRGWVRAAGFVATIVGSTGLAAAGDTFDLQKKDVWKVGDVLTTTVSERDDREMRYTEADGSALASPPQKILVEAKLLEKCLAVDPAGNRTRSMVYVVAWTAKDGPKVDVSLAGCLIEVAGVGKERAAKIATSKEEPSKAARAWLGRRYGAGRPEPASARAYWLPKAPVAVGDGWGADLAPFLDASAAGSRLDRSRTTSSCSLVSADKTAVVRCEASLALASFPGNEKGKPIPWKSGGVQIVKGTITLGLATPIASSKLVFSTTLEGEAELGGKGIAVLVRTDRTVDDVVGGEWPADLKLPETTAPGDAGMGG